MTSLKELRKRFSSPKAKESSRVDNSNEMTREFALLNLDPEAIQRMESKATRAFHVKNEMVWQIDGTGFDATLYFGAHKGQKISELVEHDYGYLRWMMKEHRNAKKPGDKIFENTFITDDLISIIKYQIAKRFPEKARGWKL